jgi:hypothetical protein
LLEEVFGGDVDDELAGAADVSGGVLGDEALAGAVGYADAYHRRVDAEVVVGAEGGGVEASFFVKACYERDWARGYEADEEVVNCIKRDFVCFDVNG